jgi:predicted nucleotidyltransferase
MLGEFLRKLAAALEGSGVPYMLTGSLASSLYGVPRATNDIDFVISPTRAQLGSLLQFLKRLGFLFKTSKPLKR